MGWSRDGQGQCGPNPPFTQAATFYFANTRLAKALDELEAKDLICEPGVVASLLPQRAPGLGTLRVQRELQQIGIAPVAIVEVVACLQGTELERALALWQRRYDGPASDPKEYARQKQFLMGRGFAPEVVQWVLGERVRVE